MTGKIKFVKRGGALAATLAADDVGAYQWGQAAPSPLDISRTNDLELPSSISVVYQDVLSDYQQATQISKRMTGSSMNPVSLPMPMTLSAQKAKQIADVNLFNAWSGRTTYTLTVSRKWSKLEPTDVIDVPVGSVVHRMRIIKKDDSKSLIKLEAVFEDLNIYTQSGTGSSLSSTPVQTITITSQTIVNYLDLPCLTDSENDAGFYVAAGGFRAGWGGCTLFKSADAGATYSLLDSIVNQSVMGYTSNRLGDFAGKNIFDEINSVTVVLSNGDMSLSSVTEVQVLNKYNVALLGSEIIQFRDATLIAANTYTLTGLLRGRKGTERNTGSHSVGEKFIVLDSNTTWRAVLTTAEIGLARTYKAVTIGMTLQQTVANAFTNTAEALECYEPIDVAVGLDSSGNATINWKRQNRLSQEWRDYADVPQSEATESYTIEIYATGAFAVLKRTLTSSTPTVSYSAANQVTDFGGNQSYFNIRVYQSSAINGLGHYGSFSNYVTQQQQIWFTDMYEQTAGVAPAGWTERYATANFSTSVVDVSGNKNITFTVTVPSRAALSWDMPTTFADGGVLVKMKPAYTLSTGGYECGMVYLRASGATASETAYCFEMNGFSQLAEICILNAGARTQLAVVTGGTGSIPKIPNSTANTDYYMIRFQAVGTAVKAKFWIYGTAEPIGWMLEATNATISAAGWIGIGTYATTDKSEIDEVTIYKIT